MIQSTSSLPRPPAMTIVQIFWPNATLFNRIHTIAVEHLYKDAPLPITIYAKYLDLITSIATPCGRISAS